MKLIHIDAISALVGVLICAGILWLILATLNPVR